MNRILLVEDDLSLNEGMVHIFSNAGFTIKSCHSGEEAFNEKIDTYDLIILDVNLPGMTGFEIAKKLTTFYHVPILFLTASDEEEDMLKGYALGCEDYICKPFSHKVLIEKVKVILKRNEGGYGNRVYIYEDFIFDFERLIFMKSNQEIFLTTKERGLLQTLTSYKNKTITKNQLITQVWTNEGDYVDDNTLSVTVKRLRQKIETHDNDPKWIRTVYGIGYKWCEYE